MCSAGTGILHHLPMGDPLLLLCVAIRGGERAALHHAARRSVFDGEGRWSRLSLVKREMKETEFGEERGGEKEQTEFGEGRGVD